MDVLIDMMYNNDEGYLVVSGSRCHATATAVCLLLLLV